VEKEREERDQARQIRDQNYERAKKIIDEEISHLTIRNVSLKGDYTATIDALLDRQEDKNRKIELCNEIIKYCRNKSIELQRTQ
jgi:hypothetical protein